MELTREIRFLQSASGYVQWLIEGQREPGETAIRGDGGGGEEGEE